LNEVQDALKLLLGVEIPPDKFMNKFDDNHSGDLDVYEFETLVEEVKSSNKAQVEEKVHPSKGSILGKKQEAALPGQRFLFLQ